MAYFVWKQKHFRLTAEGLEHMAAFIGQGPPMRPFDRHVKQPITVHFVQRHVSGRGNVTTIANRCVKLSDVFKKNLYRKLYIFHILLEILDRKSRHASKLRSVLVSAAKDRTVSMLCSNFHHALELLHRCRLQNQNDGAAGEILQIKGR